MLGNENKQRGWLSLLHEGLRLRRLVLTQGYGASVHVSLAVTGA
jgi:hypothetical protein